MRASSIPLPSGSEEPGAGSLIPASAPAPSLAGAAAPAFPTPVLPGVHTVTSSSDARINALIDGYAWNGSELTYSFPDSSADYDGSYAYFSSYNEPSSVYFGQVAAQEMRAFQAIFEGTVTGVGSAVMAYGSYESFTNLNFTNTGTGTSDLRIAVYAHPSNNPTAYAYYPSDYGLGGDIWIGTDFDFTNPIVGSWAYLASIHESGHALGLKHPHETGSTGTPVLAAEWDSLEFTVMSYRSFVGGPVVGGYSNEEFGYPTTPMMLDIAALQHLYGADFTTNSGNTTYSWSPTTGEMFLNGVGQGAPGANRIFLTIWDGGGRDTYDMSNYANGVSIDLTPGKWSVTAQGQRALLDAFDTPVLARGNVFNALLHEGDTRSLIEDAIGGAGNDTIMGNQGANSLQGNGGADTLTGGLGNDTIDGGGGTDSAVLSGNRSGYAVAWSGGALVVTGADGTDSITNVENLVFADGVYAASAFGATVSIAALSAAKAEGRSGTTAFTFTVTRTGETGGAQTVDWAVAGSGANLAGAADFVGAALPSGTVSFAAGETSKTVTVNVAGDLRVEATEGFSVTLSNASAGLTIGTASALGAIWNDDFVARLNLDGVAGEDLVWQSGGQFAYTNAVAGLGQNRSVGTPGADYEFVGAGQIDGAGGADLIWAKAGGGAMVGLGSGSPLSFALVPVARPGSGWSLWTQGDLNGDGRVDLLWKQGESLAVTQLGANGAKLGDTWLGAPGAGWVAVDAVKLNGDANVDILWKNDALGGALASTLVSANGLGFASAHWLSMPGVGWSYAATGDFDGDGRADSLWREANGHIAVMFTAADGTTNAGAYWFSKPGTGWELVDVGDFNGDGRADTAWQNASFGGAIATFITRSSVTAGGVNADGYWWGLPGEGWHYAGVADANGDGRDDILFEAAGGDAAVMLAGASGAPSGATYIGTPGSDWHLVG